MRSLSRLAILTAAAAVAAARPAMPIVRTPDGPKTRWRGARAPNGQSFRSLRRAFNSGWEPPVVKIKNPDRYLHSHARQMKHLREAFEMRGAS